MNNQKTIMYIIDHFHVAGGTETHLSILVRNLNRKKYKCLIVVFDFVDNPLAEKIQNAGIPIIHIPVGRYYSFNAFLKAIQLSRLIKHKKVDLVQTFHIKSDFYGALIAKMSGVKHIISSKRDTGDLKSKWHFFLNRLVKNIFQGVIAVSNSVGVQVSNTEFIPMEKIRTIYNGVRLEKFVVPDADQRNAAREKLGYTSSDFIVGTVAWFRPEKSYDVLFKAIKMVSDRIEEIKVIAVGGGPLLDYYKSYVKEMGLSSIVHLVGPTDNVMEYTRAFDVACLVPTKNEGLSNSVLEKMSMGLPLIVTDVGGNSELVINDYNGYVISPGDIENLAESIFQLYQDPLKREDMGRKSRERVQSQFTISKMIEQHEMYYDFLLKRG